VDEDARLAQVGIALTSVAAPDGLGRSLEEADDAAEEDVGLEVELERAREVRRAGGEKGWIVQVQGR